ncbi:MAG: NAD(P)-dependent oxidoreductase [Gammaproteobacteria bacterium]|nr:NAD(P)-dependent oxidoreductase [Gammaproteobacteria bacterium]
MKHQKRNALITGVTGYIGSNLSRELINSGWEVTGIIREGSNTTPVADLQQLDLAIYDGTVDSLLQIFAKKTPAVVFHLAACFVGEHTAFQVTNLIQANVLFGTHLLEAMANTGVTKLVNTATFWQHYNGEVYNPMCLYAATKESFEKIIKFYVEAYAFQVITLELFDTYGPNDPRRKLINLLLQAAINDEELLMSPGEQKIDLVYIDDVIAAYMRASDLLLSALDRLNDKFMVATKTPKTLREIVELFNHVFKCKLKTVWGGRAYRKREMMDVWYKETILPGWQPKFTLEQGLTRLHQLQMSK